jgi:hypothetical protein
MIIRPVGAELFRADRQTARQTDGQNEANSCFSQFCESAPKHVLSFSWTLRSKTKENFNSEFQYRLSIQTYSTQLTCILTFQTVQLEQHYIQKGKAVPLQAWSFPEGSRKLRFPDYMATVQDGGKVVSLTHRPPLPPGNAPGTHFC